MAKQASYLQQKYVKVGHYINVFITGMHSQIENLDSKIEKEIVSASLTL
jgi:actin-related protein